MMHTSNTSGWQKRFIYFISSGRVPFAAWIIFMMLTAGFFMHLGPWLEGNLAWGQVDGNQFNFLVWFLFILFSFKYFLDYSENVAVRIHNNLDIDSGDIADLGKQFTQVSASTGWALTGLSLVLTLLEYDSMFPWRYSQDGLTKAIIVLVSTILLSFAFALIYLLVRQELLVSRLYKRVKLDNIFHLESLYVFSDLTTRIGMFSILAGILAYLTNIVFVTSQPQVENFWLFGSMFFSLALAAFFLPSLGIHTRLEEEKERASRENDKRIQKVFTAVLEHVDGTRTAGLSEMKEQLSTLLTFREEIAKISTWPWDSATLRTFLSALTVPTALWLIQSLLSRFVSF